MKASAREVAISESKGGAPGEIRTPDPLVRRQAQSVFEIC
jgi:hypothetical protein